MSDGDLDQIGHYWSLVGHAAEAERFARGLRDQAGNAFKHGRDAEARILREVAGQLESDAKKYRNQQSAMEPIYNEAVKSFSGGTP